MEKKCNKNYCSFKAGFFNVFGVQWYGTKTFGFFVKILENEAKPFLIKMTRYDNQWKQAVYHIDPKVTITEDFRPIFRKAYERQAGKA